MTTENGTGPARLDGPARLGPLPDLAADTTAERPWPLRLLLTKIDGYVAKMSPVWVEGQVIAVNSRPSAGTVYVTLRDADVDMSMQVTVWQNVMNSLRENLPDGLREGARVVVRAKPSFYAKRGMLSLQASDIRPVGEGELLAQLERMKRRLEAEGLFSASRKKRLPFLPRVVGLVCGRGSAAEHDVVENARLRWPGVRFDIRAVAVQGVKAVEQVTAALQELDAEGEVDVIVITRGGGSVEDLLAFSNETLVRAVAAARTPVVSAIGHETDSPLLDFVADVRASTPTDAARRVVPDVAEEARQLGQARTRMRTAVAGRLAREESALAAVRSRPALAAPQQMLDARVQELDLARGRMRTAVASRLDRAGDEVRHLRRQVAALSPAATLTRGYAVVQTGAGRVVRAPEDVTPGEMLRLRVAEGELSARAE
ncbi:exodeoxyribonuclease VII large subunit [Kineococcus xinjiangensis]|uniref:Exodeoxyribonuclease 7 large subunit n=1 Tax=Kineococcus xinjiangensis TaxID=512762 RepID=A0A2S6IWY6_9ACTN|nr:exodeoxyribonuclease VII large subunit [Kineococcus xinjiangensis]PPK98872.1 exodeoxyribonuclease VII large subunit [Kineococcus xinjiangensis]